jgi:hypothetical protein
MALMDAAKMAGYLAGLGERRKLTLSRRRRA